MDAVAALTQTISRTTDAANLYGVTKSEIADAAATVASLDRHQRHAYATTAVLGTLVSIAGQHQAECDRDGCRTCAAVRTGLAGTIAGLRLLVSDAGEKVAR